MSQDRMRRRDFMKGAVASSAGLGMLAAADTAAQDAAPAPAAEAPQKVPRKIMGKTGLEIPILLMGCCQTMDAKYDKRLHRAYELGVDFLDTAQMYADGQNQKQIAPFIKQIGDRKKLIISSKAFQEMATATAKGYMDALDVCLADLQTDYLDIFFLHMTQDARVFGPEFLKMADDMKKSGKIRFFGISTHHGNVPEIMNKAAEVGAPGIDTIMFRYNFRQYGDKELNLAIDNCKNAGIGLLAMKTLGSIPDDAQEALPWTNKELTLTQAKLKAVWADERIDSIASQMGNVEHVMENAAAAISPVKLSMNDFVQLNRLAAQTAPLYCTGCSHKCESCVHGNLRIADTLRYLMYFESYGQRDTARAMYQALRDDERDFRHLDLSQAVDNCPQGINIAERLEKARNLLA